MKPAIIIIIVIISVALLVTGILYGEYPHRDHVKAVTLEETYNTQTPAQTPDMVIEPMSSFPAY
jgi:hypothetical protein